MTVLETERLLLRKPVLEDAEAALALITDPVAMEHIGGVHPDAASDPEFVVRRWLERWDDNGCGPFSIVRREDGHWLGRTGLLVWDVRTWTVTTFASAGEHAQPELGWALVREHWGSGYATEAALAVRDWAYRERGLGGASGAAVFRPRAAGSRRRRLQPIGRLVSVISPANARSQRLAERLGATPVETVTLFDTDAAVVWEHPR